MNKWINIFFLFFVFALFMHGCSSETKIPPAFLPSSENQKINNLIDFNNDKKSDLILWNTSSMSTPGKFLEPCFFEIVGAGKDNYKKFNYGEIADIPFAGFFDEDGIVDLGVYRYGETSSEFIIKNGANESGVRVTLGLPGDLPVPNDFNGDGKYDLVVYRPKDKTFYGVLSSNNVTFQAQLGDFGDIPVCKDYDGDSRTDFATYSPKTGIWRIRTSRNSEILEQKLGGENFLPIPADYDGDGKADICVWNKNENKINAVLSTLRRQISSDIVQGIQKEIINKDFFPVPLDYDGDGASELAFWNSSSKILLTFDIRETLKKKTYHFNSIKNSLPVQNFLLKRQILKNDIFTRDFDGDYIPDTCIWSKDTGSFLCNSTRVGWKFALQVGQATDIPVIGNFNADNITDIGVYRPLGNSFHIRYLGKFAPKDIEIIKLANKTGTNLIPKIADYDRDGIDDLAVFNSSSKTTIVRKSSDLQEVNY